MGNTVHVLMLGPPRERPALGDKADVQTERIMLEIWTSGTVRRRVPGRTDEGSLSR
jgi:hypothetical protein